MFVAITLYVYDVPSVNPVHRYVVAFVPIVHVAPAGEDVTTYPVTTDPPLLTGAVNVMVADPDVVLAAVTDVGASGTVYGTTLDEAVEAEEVNSPLLAVTANV
jgi:hypothetical protein